MAGQSVVDAHNKAIEKNNTYLRINVLDMLSRTDHSRASSTEQPTNELENTNNFWTDALTFFLLETPILLLVLVLAVIVGYNEGWSWDER